jgi:hypothetical protein
MAAAVGKSSPASAARGAWLDQPRRERVVAGAHGPVAGAHGGRLAATVAEPGSMWHSIGEKHRGSCGSRARGGNL